ncbi:MAG: flagellar hook-length control protein FliK [Methylophilaceae bacterium]
MIKLPDMISVQPMDKVTPILSTVRIADAIQDLDFRATQLLKGQDYYAHVLSKVDDKTFMVKVEGAILKMDLSKSTTVGQTLLLKYINDAPQPTFMLVQQNVTAPKNEANLSPTGRWIDQKLKEAEKQGVTAQYVSDDVVTNTPKTPQVVAQELKNALTNSGLFYESHLRDFVEGQRTLQAVMQEPQNQPNAPTTALMAQQLAILENQRLVWRGEVWPGQMMDWEVERRDESSNEDQAASSSQTPEQPPISSVIVLHLPKLGKVSARIRIANDQVQVNISALDAITLDKLKVQSMHLVNAFELHGQKLEALTVTADE